MKFIFLQIIKKKQPLIISVKITAVSQIALFLFLCLLSEHKTR